MNKKETIQAIQKKLEGSRGFPVMDYLMKLTEMELFNLLSAIAFSHKFAKTHKEQKESKTK